MCLNKDKLTHNVQAPWERRTGETVTREPGLLCDSRRQGQEVKVHDLMSLSSFLHCMTGKVSESTRKEKLIRGC